MKLNSIMVPWKHHNTATIITYYWSFWELITFKNIFRVTDLIAARNNSWLSEEFRKYRKTSQKKTLHKIITQFFHYRLVSYLAGMTCDFMITVLQKSRERIERYLWTWTIWWLLHNYQIFQREGLCFQPNTWLVSRKIMQTAEDFTHTMHSLTLSFIAPPLTKCSSLHGCTWVHFFCSNTHTLKIVSTTQL